MIVVPLAILVSLIASAILDLSYLSMFERIGTVERKFSYFYLLFWEASFTIWLNVFLSRTHRADGSTALMVAALGALYRRASSPKTSPGLYFFRNVSVPLITLWHDKSPDSTM